MQNIMALSLDDQFNFAVEQIRSMPTDAGGRKGPTDTEKLTMYGLYKQATVGDCNTARPGMLDFVGKAKWDSWNSRRGMSKQNAKTAYCTEFLKMADKYDV